MNIAEDFRENCGFGLIANVRNQPSHELLANAISALSRMIHRGAIAADGKTGDGSGVLCSMPREFVRNIARENGIDLPEQYAVAMVFTTDTDRQKGVFERVLQANDLRVLFWRQVPTETEALGEYALRMMPGIWQAFVVPGSLIATKRFRALLYLSRKDIERELMEDRDFYIASFSDRVLSYKGLVMPTYIRQLYPDLRRDDFRISFALFHQRFSTNTLPRWKLAQPLRTLAHNGEINSIMGNRFKAETKFGASVSQQFNSEEFERLFPLMQKDISDSGSLDNMFEFMIANGMDFFKAIRSLIPPPRHNVSNMPAKLRSFYEYQSGGYEPWDGPAAVALTDGRYVGCILDRNGLRPAKYIITRHDELLISSEFGVLDTPDEDIRERGRLQSGQMIAADLDSGRIFYTRDIDRYIMNSQPYSKWLTENTHFLQEFIERQFEDNSDYQFDDLVKAQRYHNITNEVCEMLVRPMMTEGKEPTGSMGDDAPLAAFSDQQRNFVEFFRQKFAQVTNPAIDPIREKAVMSTTTGFGETPDLLGETARRAQRLKVVSPILSREIFDTLLSFGNPDHPRYEPCYRCGHFTTEYRQDLRGSLHALGDRVVDAVRDQEVRTLILDDRRLDAEHRTLPMPMVIGYVNQRLKSEGLHHHINMVVCTGEVVDSHSAAVMLGYGATAIYPYLLYATAYDLLQREHPNARDCRVALKRVYEALTKGLLKIMSKMGISTVSSYRNASLFDIIGLSKQIGDECFPGSALLLSGLGYEQIDQRLTQVHERIYGRTWMEPQFPLEIGGFYRYVEGREFHDFGPRVVTSLHRFAESRTREDYLQFRSLVENRGEQFVRDFLQFASDRDPIDIREVESVSDICKRFDSAAMSLGALSPEAHEALAEAMNRVGGRSNSGEGGEAAARFRTVRNSRIKQIASGRFGVTPGYLRSAEEIQIKLAQGAKPGEGGQLPGHKVTPLIASLRFTIPGVTLISPPPHHDIYSIEDLAQLIFDLKQVNPDARISVKLVSSQGVGTIAAGVAKAYADKIIISGADGGTGAAQHSSIKFAGNPWELGLAEAQQSLMANDLRGQVELQTDGGLKIGSDVVKAALLGAESYGFGTPLLAILGCKLLRVCHLNRCTVGIATQDETLRAHYRGTVEKVVAYLENLAEDIREILAHMGYRCLDELVGRVDLLAASQSPKAASFDFGAVLHRVDGVRIRQCERNVPFDDNAFEKSVLREVMTTIRNPTDSVVVERQIINTNRSFGAMVSGVVARYYGDQGLPKDSIVINLRGSAGQSLGAFLNNGITLYVSGVANDYAGKGMHGGQIIVVPPMYRENNSVVGNTCLYGATGGKFFVAGTAGERFAVRNSGALAVVEGTGDHACEYMTGGAVAILGPTGINFGAGMTGGVAFVYDEHKNFIDKLNQELVVAKRIDVDDDNEGKLYLRKILTSYYNKTRSAKVRSILSNFREELARFWMVIPKDMKSPLNPMDGD